MILLLLFALFSTSHAGDWSERFVIDTTTRQISEGVWTMLKVPRTQIHLSQTKGKMFYYTYPAIRMSTDTARTTDASYSPSTNVLGSISDHFHSYLSADDSLFMFAWTQETGLPAGFALLTENGTAFTESFGDITTWETYNSSLGPATGIRIEGTDSLIYSSRISGSAYGRFWVSDDLGDTWSYVDSLYDTSHDLRIGMLRVGAHYLYIAYQESGSYAEVIDVWEWTRGGNDFTLVHSNGFVGTNRNIGFAGNGVDQFLLYSFEDPYKDTLKFFMTQYDWNGSSWGATVYDTLWWGDGNGGGSAPTMFFSSMSYLENLDVYGLVYNYYYNNVTTTDDSIGLAARVFDPATSTWTNPVRVSSGYKAFNTAGSLTGHNNTPSTWGSSTSAPMFVITRQTEYAADEDVFIIELTISKGYLPMKGLLK